MTLIKVRFTIVVAIFFALETLYVWFSSLAKNSIDFVIRNGKIILIELGNDRLSIDFHQCFFRSVILSMIHFRKGLGKIGKFYAINGHLLPTLGAKPVDVVMANMTQ
jgi:hypothetical protein